MPSYEDLEEVALVCARHAYATALDGAAVELWRLAEKYQSEAAKIKDGKPVDIGEPPPWVR